MIIAALGVSNILLTNFGTIVHEIGGHVLVAKLMGCNAEGSTDIYTGSTSFYDCPLGKKTSIPCDADAQCNDQDTSTNEFCEEGSCIYEKKIFNIFIALASITVVFFLGFGIWIFFNENSILRVFAVIMIFYSAIPSAFPLLPGSDMAYAISQGFPLWLAWVIYIGMAGAFLWVLIDEITDSEFFRKWIE